MSIIEDFYQDPLMQLTLWNTTRSILDQCRRHDSGGNPPQHLHQSSQYGWTSRWRDFRIESSRRDCQHLKQTDLKLGKGKQNLSPSLHSTPKSNSRGAFELSGKSRKRLTVVCTTSSTWMIYWQEILDTVSTLGTQCSTTQGTSQPPHSQTLSTS